MPIHKIKCKVKFGRKFWIPSLSTGWVHSNKTETELIKPQCVKKQPTKEWIFRYTEKIRKGNYGVMLRCGHEVSYVKANY